MPRTLPWDSSKAKYRRYINVLNFFYPSLKMWRESEDSESMRKRIIEALNVIDKYGSRVGTIDEQVKHFEWIDYNQLQWLLMFIII